MARLAPQGPRGWQADHRPGAQGRMAGCRLPCVLLEPPGNALIVGAASHPAQGDRAEPLLAERVVLRFALTAEIRRTQRERRARSLNATAIDRLDDRAARGVRPMFAILDHMLERSPHALEIGDPRLDLREAGPRDPADRTPVGPVLQLQQFADFLEREAEFLRAADEAK